MKAWCVIPRDGALFRDARPFIGSMGATSLALPWPSTLAGFVRTRMGTDNTGRFAISPTDARSIAVSGPWLAELDADDRVIDQLFPAPADVVLFQKPGSGSSLQRRRLVPLSDDRTGGFISDLRDGLIPVGLADPMTEHLGKPSRGPEFWYAKRLREWLSGAAPTTDSVTRDELGVDALPRDERIHVAIEPSSLTAAEGALYSTTEQRFEFGIDGRGHRRFDDHVEGHEPSSTTPPEPGRRTRRFGLMCRTQPHDHENRMLAGPGTLGGERRISLVREAADNLSTLIPVPEIRTRRLRVVLVTPSVFAQGALPTTEVGNAARVVGACVGRPLSVSGWCFEHKGPKPARRMVAAGSVYWLDFDSTEDARSWAHRHHFTNLAATGQDVRDGFGLIAVGNA